MKRVPASLIAVIAALAVPMLALAGPVDINRADAETLARELTGIGPAKAAAIVQFREANGPFGSPDDLTAVEGIGAFVIEQNRANILVESNGE